MHTRTRRYFPAWLVFMLTLFIGSQSMAAELTAEVSRTSISANDSVNLTVRFDGAQSNQAPDFSGLQDDFDIVNQTQSSQYINTNGKATVFTEWQLTLMPKREGRLLIPSFKLKNTISDAIEINVTAAANGPVTGNEDVFLETVIDDDSVYVQQQVLVKYRLYFAVSLRGAEPTPLDIPDVIKEEMETQQYTKRIKGVDYRVAEMRYAIYPQSSGKLEIPALPWTIQIATNSRIGSSFGLGGRYQLKRLRTDAKTITVKARPASFPKDAVWLPASNLDVQEDWSQSPDSFKVGEPLTRTLTITADGLMSSQLPKGLPSDNNQNVKIYAEQPSFNQQQTDDGIRATRTESAAIIVTKPGESELPAIRIPWWDVKSDTLKYAEIPARTITANGIAASPYDAKDKDTKPATNDNANQNSAGDSAPLNIEQNPHTQAQVILWRILTALATLAALIFAILWLKTRHQLGKQDRAQATHPNSPQATSQRKALSVLQHAASQQDLKRLRQALLVWAQHHWPKANIQTLQQVQKHIDDPALQQSIQQLESSLYKPANTTTFDGQKFITALNAWLSQEQKKEMKQQQESGLEGMYKTS